MFAAWTVCSAWQDTLRYIVEADHQRFYVLHPCPPVDCRTEAGTGLRWIITSAEELATFDENLADAQRMVDDMPSTRFEMASRYFCARLTQASNLREEVSAHCKLFDWYLQEYHLYSKAIMTRNALAEGRDSSPYLLNRALFPLIGVPPTHSPQRLDFSQFKLNPYFRAFLGDRITFKDGRYDTALQKSLQMPLYDSILLPDYVRALLSSMHIT
jgi:hypothetical protein